MKILHVIASADPATGGPVEGIVQLDRALRQLGSASEVVSTDSEDASFLRTFPVKVHALGQRRKNDEHKPGLVTRYGFTPAFIPWLKAHARDYDRIIVNGFWNFAAFGASIALRNKPVPYYVYTHGMMDPWFRRQYPVKHWVKQAHWLACEGPLLSRAAAVLFTADDELSRASDAFFGYRYKEIVAGYGTAEPPVATDAMTHAFRKAVPGLKDRRFLLFMSRIHPKKGCDLLVETFAKVAQSAPEVDLVMAGPDQTLWQPALIAIADRQGMASRIHWPGMLQGDAKWGAFRCSDAFVLPSHQENFGVAVAEALACAKPVLITDKINIWREVADAQAGLISSDDLEGTHGSLVRFLAMSSDERSAMGARGRNLFEKKFEATANARRLLAILESNT